MSVPERDVLAPLVVKAYSWVSLGIYLIPERSMEGTILPGDRILVCNGAYRVRVPFTEATLIQRGKPERGDIVTFRCLWDPGRLFAMRVIGLPGEEVEVRDGAAYIDGGKLAEPYLEGSPLPRGAFYPERDFGPETVPPGQYFILGDNRPTSRDSRVIGFVPEEFVVGRVEMVLSSVVEPLPYERVASRDLAKPADKEEGDWRWERLGMALGR